MKKKFKTTAYFIIVFCCLLIINTAHAQKHGSINGEYILSSIVLEDNSMQDTLKAVPVFEDANINCLLNSQWEFENASGFYKISKGSECARGMRHIAWKSFSLKGSNFFQFCRTSAVRGVRADEHNIYICEVKSSEKSTFTLRYPILYADKPNAILFTFTHQVY